jgi:hypothetical protein
MSSNFLPNPGFERALLANPELLPLMRLFAEAGAAGARRVAPRHTGAYADSISASFGTEAGIVTGRVASSDFFAHGIEHGSVNNPAYAPLRRGVQQAGLRVVVGEGRRA